MRARFTMALIAALMLALLPAVQAQQNTQAADEKKKAEQAAAQANPFGPGSPLGGQLAPLMMGFMSTFGGTVDMAHSNALNLLQRNDVRSELLLSAQQREKLDAMKADAQQGLISRIVSSATENFQGIQDVPQEQRLEAVQQGLSKLQDTLKTYQTDLDKDIDKLLNLKATGGVPQNERLRQLDLQWRGPLALSEQKLAEALNLTPEQRKKVSDALGEYVQAQGQAMMKAFSNVRGGAQGGGNGPGAGFQFGGFNPQDMQKKMTDAMQSEEVKKARKAAEKQVLDTLTPEQKETWNSWLGKPFTFRANNT